MWSVDPTSPAPGPGPTLTPDLARPDGTLAQSPQTQFALAINGVEVQAPVVATAPDGGTQTVYELNGGPLKLAASQTGVSGDGWLTSPNAETPAFSAYNRFDAATAGTRSRSSSSTASATPGTTSRGT